MGLPAEAGAPLGFLLFPMDNIVTSLEALVPPEIAGRLGHYFHADAAAVGKAVRVLSGLAVAGLARRSATEGGAAAALASLPQKEEPGLLASLMGALKGKIPSETPADRMQALFGGGFNSMVSALSRKLGFDLGPLAAMLTPMVGQQLAKTAKEENLDAGGFANLLQYGSEEFLAAPENAEAAAMIREALVIGEEAEVLRARFTKEELEQIHTAPMAAYAIVAKSSISGIRSSVAEIKAAHEVGLELLKEVDPVSLLGTVFGAGLTSSEAAELQQEIAGEGELIETIQGATAIVKAKAADELEDFRALVLEVAKRVAEAGKEGGFLGFGGVKVSEKERLAIGQITAALE
jgi:hypothetical protein